MSSTSAIPWSCSMEHDKRNRSASAVLGRPCSVVLLCSSLLRPSTPLRTSRLAPVRQYRCTLYTLTCREQNPTKAA